MGTKILSIVIILAGLAIALPANAHNPRIVPSSPVQINNPEISQAFYGKLSGEPQWFEFAMDRRFLLYVNILEPKTSVAKKNMSVEIYWNGQLIAWLDADNTSWTEFYEPFGGDAYWQGGEYKKEEWAGQYKIKVYNKNNSGKYSLAVGSQEEFPLAEILNTIILLPTLKKDFFDKSSLTAYFNYTGLFLLGFLLAVFIVVFIIFKIVKKARQRRQIAESSTN